MPVRSFFRRGLISILLLGLNLSGFAQYSNNIRYVNPFIGTSKSNVLTKWGSDGGTYPGAVSPSGSIQLTPETRLSGSRAIIITIVPFIISVVSIITVAFRRALQDNFM